MIIIWLILTGLVVGALGRLAIPGPNPMSIGMTILVGIGGALLAGIVGYLIFGRDYGGSILLAVAGSALIVWLIERSRAQRAT
jgi:uncharacterized membrane protein YeaQ/YmgE (transglycosylase-associated protein family)